MPTERPSGRYSSVVPKRRRPELPPTLMVFPEAKKTIDSTTVDRIVHIMAHAFPINSNESREILDSYYDEGREQLSVVPAMEHIIKAIRDKVPGVGYEMLGKYEKEIVPGYAKKLGLTVD